MAGSFVSSSLWNVSNKYFLQYKIGIVCMFYNLQKLNTWGVTNGEIV